MTDDTKIASGRCHGPGCTQTADGDFCSERCSVAWQAQFWRPTPPPGTFVPTEPRTPSYPSAAFAEVDLTPFRDAMDRAVRGLAAGDQVPAELFDPDGPTSADVLRSHTPIRVTWGDPALPTRRLRLGALADIPSAMLAVGAAFHPGARVAAEVELLNARLRAAFPDRADEVIAAARDRARTSFDTYAQAVEAVIADPEFAPASAEKQQVAPNPDPSRGWLRRLFDRWKGQP